MKKLSGLVSTGNLGDNIINKESFYEGLKRDIDYLAADAGTADAGPAFLGSDSPHNPIHWERHDLELLLLAARERKIPMIVGSCSTTGTNSAVDRYAEIVRELTKEHRLKAFKMAVIYSEVSKDFLRQRMTSSRIEALDAPEVLDPSRLERTDYITAAMGVEQLIHAFEQGADVILAGRACDDAVIAAYPIFKGFDKGVSLHMGKAAECASLVCWPQKVKESIIATVHPGYFEIEPMHPDQRATPHSVAAHSMYERTDPFSQAAPGGVLDMREARYEAASDRVTRVSGSRFIPQADRSYSVKLEGAGFAGYRAYHFVGIRDPNAIRHIDSIIENATRECAEVMHPYQAEVDYQLRLHVYGRNAVMKRLEPSRGGYPTELGVVIEALSREEKIATAAVKSAKFRLFYMSYPGQLNSSGGSVALLTDEPLYPKNKCYEWTINHLLKLEDPLDKNVFRFKFETLGS